MDRGALPTRRQVLACAGLAASALALLDPQTALAAGTSTVGSATTGPGGQVPEPILVWRMLRAARLAVYCYQQVLEGGPLSSEQTPWVSTQQAHEQVHAALLTTRLAALGGPAVSPPADAAQANRQLERHHIAQRVGQLRGPKDALRLLVSVEQLVVGSCFDALGRLHDPAMILPTLQIMATDAQHVAVLRVLLAPGEPAGWAPYALVEGNA